jgi:hypothetical protein
MVRSSTEISITGAIYERLRGSTEPYADVRRSYREGPQAFNIAENTLAPLHKSFIAPWRRTDVLGALDGMTKFDLERWNDQ